MKDETHETRLSEAEVKIVDGEFTEVTTAPDTEAEASIGRGTVPATAKGDGAVVAYTSDYKRKHIKTVYTEPKIERPINRALLQHEFDMANEIMQLHTYRRPNGSKSERKFIARFLQPLGMERDGYGNLYKRIGTDPILWSCHTDTVHYISGRQTVSHFNGMLRLHKNESVSGCLGSDDGAGVWLMMEMIRAGKEGLYIFHRAEESGGKGSSHLLKMKPELLEGIQAAIAFDRVGYESVITHQAGGKCASDDFAWSLANELNDGLRCATYMPDDSGIFTDTANYVDVIPECTNISVGNHHQHTRSETLDMPFLIALRHALIELDTSKLVIAREPGDTGYEGHAYGANDDKWWEKYNDNNPSMEDVIMDYTDELVMYLEDHNISARDLRDQLRKYRGNDKLTRGQ